MVWRPAPSRGLIAGLGLAAVMLALEAACLVFLRRSWPGPRAAVALAFAIALLGPTLLVAYWVWGRINLRYDLGRDALTIYWAGHRHVVPMDSITHILNGRPYVAPLSGFHWPGHEVGHTQIFVADDDAEPRDALVFATVPPAGQIVIVTPGVAYAISPADRAAFVDEFKMRRRLGSVQTLEQRTIPVPWLGLALWRDRIALGFLGAGLVLNVLAFAWLTWHYPTLPKVVAAAYQYDPELGRAVAGPPQALGTLWFLPFVGLSTIGVSTVLAALVDRHAQLGARILAVGAFLVQVGVAVNLLLVR